MSRKAIIAIILVVALAGAGLAWHFLGQDRATPAIATDIKGANYTITPHDMTQGDPKAKLVVIEYAAPRCPHCAHFNEATFPQLKKNYIDTGKVFYVFRVLPLAAGDGVAEKLARCLPRNKYFSFMDRLFRTQPQWDDEYGVTDVRGGLLTQAKAEGMSEAQFDACVASTQEDDTINKVAEDGMTRYNINSTPSIVIDGVLVPGVAEYGPLSKALDAALAKK